MLDKKGTAIAPAPIAPVTVVAAIKKLLFFLSILSSW
jgi:hypothetical protein